MTASCLLLVNRQLCRQNKTPLWIHSIGWNWNSFGVQRLSFTMPPRRNRKTVKVEYEQAEENDVKKTSSTVTSRTPRGRQGDEKNGGGQVDEPVEMTNDDKPEAPAASASSKGKRGKKESGGESDRKNPKFEEPPNWRTVLTNIQEMRKNKDAPVDKVGCERSMDEDVDPKVRRFQTLLSLMLSSQTKDPVTFAAMERLRSGTPLTVQKMLDISEEELGKIIIPVGFWRRKAGYIKKVAQILRDKYDDDIPNTVEDLCSLPGVGPKMAYIAMHVAWEKNVGIGVDTHVHRISNRLGWTGPKETKTPEDTRKALQSWLPPDEWQEFNILLVGFGQTICLPINPKCDACLNNQLCPFGKTQLAKISKKKNKTNRKKKSKEQDSTTDDESPGVEDDSAEDEVSQYF